MAKWTVNGGQFMAQCSRIIFGIQHSVISGNQTWPGNTETFRDIGQITDGRSEYQAVRLQEHSVTFGDTRIHLHY